MTVRVGGTGGWWWWWWSGGGLGVGSVGGVGTALVHRQVQVEVEVIKLSEEK